MRQAEAELNALRSAHSYIIGSRLSLPYVPPVRHEARLGARLDAPSDALIAHLKLEKKTGLVVSHLEKDGASATGGLKLHDVLVQVNGKKVTSDVLALRKVLSEVKPDEAITVTVIREGKEAVIKDLKLPAPKSRRKQARVPLVPEEKP
jgi:S1-C subfamily serine protease